MGSLKTKEVIFEYQESTGNFHYNLGDYPENTNGYRTIAKSTYPLWDEFTKLLNATFKDEVDFDGDFHYYHWKDERPASFDAIKHLWDAFIEVRENILDGDRI